MRIHKLESTTAFVAIDLDDTTSSGPVRWARKILHGGAQDLARSQTYTYAALGVTRGGASAGISAEADDRAEAVSAFVAETGDLVGSGTYLPDAAKGVAESDLEPLRAADPRDVERFVGNPSLATECDGLGAAVAADTAVGLEGRTVAIEGFDSSGPALVDAVNERGGRVISIATSSGSVSVDGIDVLALAQAWAAHGPVMATELGEADAAWKVFASGAEVLFTGSKMGAVNHDTASKLEGVAAVVPIGRLPFTAKALAVFRRADVAALPDFVSLAGPSMAAWGDPTRTNDEIRAEVNATVAALVEAAGRSDDGPFLGACYEAESFLRTWQDTLPFGRPLAP